MTNKRIFLFYILLSALLVVTSCGKRKKIGSADFPDRSTEELVNHLEQLSNLEWDFLSAKTQVEVSGSQANQSFKASIRMKRDSAMLVNISKFGVPAMQALVSNDSFKLLNRLSKCFTFEDRNALPEMIDFPVEYAHLQDLLIGKPLIFNKSFEHIQVLNNKGYEIKTKRPRNDIQNGQTPDDVFITYFLNPTNLELTKVLLESPTDSAQIEISYTGKHEKIEGLMLPVQVDIVIKTPKDEVRVVIVFNKPDIDHEKKIKLNIPENYEKCTK